MFIPYETIGLCLKKLLGCNRFESFFYNKKLEQNINYVQKNKPKTIKKIQNKLKNHEKVNVIFYCYDETKWKCQSLYDIFNIDGRFEVKVIATKSSAENLDNPTYQSSKKVAETYDFFKGKNMNVEFGYDIKKGKFIPFKKFNPDIVIYQHPWYVERSQGPVICSKFAITCYVPYYFPFYYEGVDTKIDYYLRFHNYIENYYVFDELVEKACKDNIKNKKVNIKAVGYPNLDNFNSNTTEEGYIIYAPHWSFGNLGRHFGTFEWSGKFMLEYAKNHPEIKWVFRPHPILYKSLTDSGFFSKKEVENYYDEWDKVGIKYDIGEYFELFNKSKMMITDSCTFLGEYFVTGKPLIWIVSDNSPFKNQDNYILNSYYCANNNEELLHLLNTLPDNDFMKEQRMEALKNSNLKNNSAKKIADDIIKIIGG